MCVCVCVCVCECVCVCLCLCVCVCVPTCKQPHPVFMAGFVGVCAINSGCMRVWASNHTLCFSVYVRECLHACARASVCVSVCVCVCV